MTQTLDFILAGCETKRYHTWPVLREQNIADHSARVALICAWLAGQEPPGIGANLLMAALTHDLAEHKMGDLPAPVKRALPDFAGEYDPKKTKSFRQVWDGLEQDHLKTASLDWEHTLTDQERHWLKLADAADGCFFCIRERALGNKLIAPVYINFFEYLNKETDFETTFEAKLVYYISDAWGTAVAG